MIKYIRKFSKRRGPSLKRECDRLWSECVKARAQGKSELSGLPGQVGHHLVTKPNYRLRYELDNGIWITKGEHFSVHYTRPRMLDACMESKRGADLWDRLDLLRRPCKCDLRLIKIMLEQKLKEITGA